MEMTVMTSLLASPNKYGVQYFFTMEEKSSGTKQEREKKKKEESKLARRPLFERGRGVLLALYILQQLHLNTTVGIISLLHLLQLSKLAAHSATSTHPLRLLQITHGFGVCLTPSQATASIAASIQSYPSSNAPIASSIWSISSYAIHADLDFESLLGGLPFCTQQISCLLASFCFAHIRWNITDTFRYVTQSA